jgi:hypothetical protein
MEDRKKVRCITRQDRDLTLNKIYEVIKEDIQNGMWVHYLIKCDDGKRYYCPWQWFSVIKEN